MLTATTAKLYRETAPAGVFETVERTEREVFCCVRSVGMREVYEAQAHGMRPELKIWLAEAFEYEGEPFVELEGVDYEIIRTYSDQTSGIELILQKRGERR